MARLAAVRPRTLAWLAVATIVVAVLLFAIWPLPQVEDLAGGAVLDTRGFGSGDPAADYLDAAGSEGRRLYAIMLTGDIFWTILHGFTVAIAIAVGITRSRLDNRVAVVAVAPLAGTVLDVIENSLFLAGIAAHPDAPPATALMGVVTGTKFIVLGIGWLAMVVALAAWFMASRQRAAVAEA